MENNNEQSKRGKKSATLLLLLILLVTVTVGFAVISATLNISGTSKITGGSWCVGPKCSDDPDKKCDDVSTCSDSVNPIETCEQGDVTCNKIDCDAHPTQCPCTSDSTASCIPAIDCTKNPDMSDPTKCVKTDCVPSETNTCQCTSADECDERPQVALKGNTFYFTHALKKPGDLFDLVVRYDNGGDIDAKVTGVDQTTQFNETAKRFMTYNVAYKDGTAIQTNDVLAAGSAARYEVKVAYKNDVTTPPNDTELTQINGSNGSGAPSLFTVTYGQK